MLFNNSIYRIPLSDTEFTQGSVIYSKKKSALLPFKILIFSIIHHVACLKQFLSFRRDLNFNSHDSIFALAPSHAADVSRPLSSFSRCITVSLWGRREGMQTTNEHGRLQELGDSLSSDWAQICGFCCHIMVAFGEQGWVKNLVTSQWNWWRQMRMFPFKIIEWQWCESCNLYKQIRKTSEYLNIIPSNMRFHGCLKCFSWRHVCSGSCSYQEQATKLSPLVSALLSLIILLELQFRLFQLLHLSATQPSQPHLDKVHTYIIWAHANFHQHLKHQLQPSGLSFGMFSCHSDLFALLDGFCHTLSKYRRQEDWAGHAYIFKRQSMFLLWYLNTSIHTYGSLKVNITHTAGIKYQDDIHLVRVCII